jgi:hypothetical protein
VPAEVPLTRAVLPLVHGLKGITVGFGEAYKRGSPFLLSPTVLCKLSPPLLTFLKLALSQSLHEFLLVFGGKERGDLDPHFHQSPSPLCEGNPLDLDLGVLCVLFLVLPLIFVHSFRCFGGT